MFPYVCLLSSIIFLSHLAVIWSILASKSMFLFGACIQSVVMLKAFYTLPRGTPVHSDTNSFLWEASHAAIMRDDYSLIFPPPSMARYSFIQMSELRHHGENENVQTSKRQQREIRTWCLSIASPAFYH